MDNRGAHAINQDEALVEWASEMGLAPGEFPPTVSIDGVRFFKHVANYRDGEITHVIYHNISGRVLTVYND